MKVDNTTLHEQHLARVRTSCRNFFNEITEEEHKLLVEEMRSWRLNGPISLPAIRKKVSRVLNLDPHDPRAMQKCEAWLQTVGFYFIGRDCRKRGEFPSSQASFVSSGHRKDLALMQAFEKQASLNDKLTYDQQEDLARELVKWPRYKPGYFFPKVRKKIGRVLGINPSHKYSIELCVLWIETIGFYYIGRDTYAVDTLEGTQVFGPAPSNCNQDSGLDFPYHAAEYHEENDEWVLPENHELYNEFFNRSRTSAA